MNISAANILSSLTVDDPSHAMTEKKWLLSAHKVILGRMKKIEVFKVPFMTIFLLQQRTDPLFGALYEDDLVSF